MSDPRRVGQNAWREHAWRDVDIVLQIHVEGRIDCHAFQPGSLVVRLHDDEDIDVRIGSSIAAGDRSEQAHINEVTSQDRAETPEEVGDGRFAAPVEWRHGE